MVNIPIIPVSFVATLAALIVFDRKVKNAESSGQEDKDKLKKIRSGLMVTSAVLCAAMMWHFMTLRKSTASNKHRIANASNVVRSSLSASGGRGSGDADFKKRVAEAATSIRKRISEHGIRDMGYDDLAARASSELSQFISANS